MTEQAKTPSGANAPYKIVKQGGKWVVKNNIGEVKASYDGNDAGYQKALAFQRALYVNVHGAGKRADKVKFTGKAKNRIKSDMNRRAEIAANLPKVPEGMPRHNFLSNVDNKCLACGQVQLHPLHGIVKDMTPADVLANPQSVPLLPLTKAEYTGSGCMVALYPDAAGLDGITINGGPDFPVEKREDMHITMCYLPETPTGDQLELLKSVVEDMARTQEPMDGVWGGTALFNPSEGSDGKPVLVALPDIPDLSDFRQDLVDALDAAGFTVSRSHGYTPHLTVAYDDNGRLKAEGDLHFDSIVLATSERFTYPLTGEIDTEQAKLTAEQEASIERENERIKESSQTAEAKGVHTFKPAQWTHPNGHPRCKVCGQEESISPECNREPTKAEQDAFQEKLDKEFAAAIEQARAFVQDKVIPARTAGIELAHDDHFLEELQDKLVTGVDAAVDQVMTLLRSTPDLPPYAAQAQSLLELVDEAVDFLMLIRALPDADDAKAQAQDQATQDSLLAGLGEQARAFGEARAIERLPQPPADLVLPTTKAFLTEVHGRTLLTAPASVWEKALTPNQHFLWVQGRFVGAQKANRNGAYWSTADLEMGEPTVKHGPLNWLHEDRHIIGSIADAKLVIPGKEAAADQLQEPHIVAVAAAWKWLYPDETFVMEQASDQGKLWYSMECVSDTVTCMSESGGCGKTFPYIDMIKASYNVCTHIRERSGTRHFHDPTFLGGAVIVPPVRPGWGEANASVMREAAALAEQAFDQAGHPDMTASEWELLMAQVVGYAAA